MEVLVDLALHRYVPLLSSFRAITVSLGALSSSLLLPRSQKRPKLSYVATDCTYDTLRLQSLCLSVTGSLGRPFWKICMVSDRRQVLGFASE